MGKVMGKRANHDFIKFQAMRDGLPITSELDIAQPF